jgi:hypothetical protein
MTSAMRTTGDRLPARSWAPTVGVGLHDLPLLRGQRALLEQHAIGDRDLADVVHRGGVHELLGLGLGHPDVEGELGAHAAHPRDVDAGGVVARLGRVGEAADELELALAQVGGALAHLDLQA